MKKTYAVVLIIVLALILASLLVACKSGEQNTDSVDSSSKTEKDPFYTDGYTKATIPSYEYMYTDLIGSVSSAVNVMSTGSITSSSPCCTVGADAEVTFNGAKYYLNFNLGYDKSNNKDLRWQASLFDVERNKIIDVVYFDNDLKPTTDIYFTIGESQFKVPFVKDIVNKNFPLTINSDLSKWFSNVFNSVIRTKEGTTKYEYKLEGGRMNRHYAFEVDILNTLKQLYNLASVFSYDTKNITFILQSVLGVSEQQIESGRIPNSSMSFEFFSLGGYQDKAGGGSLKSAKAVINIEASDTYKDTVFEGNDCQISLNINNIVANKSRNTNPPEESSFAGFVELRNQTFNFSEEIVFKNEPGINYQTDLTLLYDTATGENTEVHCVVKNRQSEEVRFTLDYANGTLDTLIMGKELSIPFDITKAIDMLSTHLVEYKAPSVVMVIAFFVGAITVKDYVLSVEFINKNFKEISGIDATLAMNIISECTSSELNIGDYLAENEIDLQTVFDSDFTLKINLKKAINSQTE